MAIIQSYPINENVTVSDLLLSATKVLQDGRLVYQTKSIRVGDIMGGNVTPISLGVANGLILQSGILSLGLATASLNGALSAANWINFNAAYNDKINSISVTGTTTKVLTLTQQDGGTLTASWTDNDSTITLGTANGLSLSGTVLSLGLAGSASVGALSAANWNTFNNKQPEGNYITALTGEATATGPGSVGITLSNTAVIGKVLTGFNVTDSAVSGSDTVLSAFGKLQGQINGLLGGTTYRGTWNATTNSPALTSSVGTSGYYYVVSVAGGTNLNGITDWKVGDWVIFQGSVWQKVDNTDSVSSVNGFVGAVVLTKGNIGLGNVDDTSDANKPVSTATQTALNLKANISGQAFSGNISAPNLSGTNTGDKTLAELGGVPTTRTITINGVNQDLSADRSYTVTATTAITGNYRISTGVNTIYSPTGVWQAIPEMFINYIAKGSAVLVNFSMPVTVLVNSHMTRYRFVITNTSGTFIMPLTEYRIFSDMQMVTMQYLLTAASGQGNILFNEENTIRVDWYSETSQSIHRAEDGPRKLISIPLE